MSSFESLEKKIDNLSEKISHMAADIAAIKQQMVSNGRRIDFLEENENKKLELCPQKEIIRIHGERITLLEKQQWRNILFIVTLLASIAFNIIAYFK
jgi:regulator of replication initiation timing